VPYLKLLLREDWRSIPALADAVNVEAGSVVLPALLTD